jgi:RNA polymerase sigma factor (sigma-70 family)
VDTTGGDPGVDPTLLAVLRQLPQRQREVIVLRVFLDLDTQATARALGMAQGTVTAHLSRAVATLRGHLVPQLSREGEA